MVFNTGSTLLDAIVLSVVSKEKEGTYGYRITQDVREAIDVSESTLYPVLRRLQKENCLRTYDQPFQGRNRRYYAIPDEGMNLLQYYLTEWDAYKNKLDNILLGTKEEIA